MRASSGFRLWAALVEQGLEPLAELLARRHPVLVERQTHDGDAVARVAAAVAARVALRLAQLPQPHRGEP